MIKRITALFLILVNIFFILLSPLIFMMGLGTIMASDSGKGFLFLIPIAMLIFISYPLTALISGTSSMALLKNKDIKAAAKFSFIPLLHLILGFTIMEIFFSTGG